MYFFKHWLVISFLGYLTLGCSSNPTGHPSFIGEGFRNSALSLNTRTVVWGNHNEAITQTENWLNDHELLVLYRWVEPNLSELESAPFQDSREEIYIRSMAHKVGATLIVFVNVSETSQKKIDSRTSQNPSHKLVKVKIQGIDVETEEMLFEGQAWNSEPMLQSKELVKDLTTLALHKALEDSQVSSPSGDFSTLDRKTPIQKEANSNDPDTNMTRSPASPPAPISNPSENGISENHSSLGLQITSGALSLFYTPFKLAYATLGGIVGGFAYAVTGGNEVAAETIWGASLGGNYWITPAHLNGEQPLYFTGP